MPPAGADVPAARGARTRLWLVIRILVACTLLAIVFRRVDWHGFGALLAHARLLWLLPVFVIITVDRCWMSGKWHYLLRQLGVHIRFLDALRVYYTSWVVGTAMSWQLGGDLARVVEVGRSSGRPALVAASVVLEKIVGAAALGLWATAAVLLLNAHHHLAPSDVAWPLAVAAALALLALPFAVTAPPVVRAVRALLSRAPAALRARKLDGTLERLALFAAAPRVVATFFALTIGEQVVPIVTVTVLAHALRLALPVIVVMAVIPISSFFTRLPLSVDALGVREGLYVYLFGLFGVTATEALALALASRVMDLLGVSAGTLVVLAISKRRARASSPSAA
jgi:glycosyltransferase 2 family protein